MTAGNREGPAKNDFSRALTRTSQNMAVIKNVLFFIKTIDNYGSNEQQLNLQAGEFSWKSRT